MIGFRMGKVTLDAKKVVDAVERSKVRVFRKIGAFVRRTARGLIRKSTKTSRPGEPPKGKTNKLKGAILFDASGRSVVIGPALTPRATKQGEPVTSTVPRVLEEGGSIRVTEVLYRGRWVRPRSGQKVAGLPRRVRTVKVEARPYMGPALQKEMPKLPELWRDSVR